MNSKAVLLVGNGINNIGEENDWKRLLMDVAEFACPSAGITIDDRKPFPLLYEQIVVEAAKRGVQEWAVKKKIADEIKTSIV